MKNRKNYLLLTPVLALGLILASCAKEGGASGKDVRGGEAYVSFELALDYNYGIRTTMKSAADAEGTTAERIVKNVHILLYEAGGSQKLAYRWEIEAGNDDGETAFSGSDVVDESYAVPTALKFVSMAKLVAKDDYDMVVLVNPTDAIIEVTENSIDNSGEASANTYVQFASAPQTSASSSNGAGDYITASKGFFMTNAYGPRRITAGQLKLGAEDAQKSPFYVGVDRIVAKILVTEDDNFNQGISNVRVSDISWVIDNMNKKTYWIRQATLAANQSAEVRTPGSETQRNLLYALDPNWAGVSAMGDEARADEFNFISRDNYDIEITAALEKSADAGPVYVLENTVPKEEQAAGKIEKAGTCILVKATVEIMIDGDFRSDYYSFGDKVFTKAQYDEWSESGSYPEDMPAGFASAWAASSFAATPAPLVYTESNGIIFHKDGMNYYTIPVRHFTSAEGVTSAAAHQGYYGVVRNNFYKINIKSISGRGTETSGKTYISAEIDTFPWIVRVAQDENLN